MPWLFGRRKSGKPAKLKEAHPAAVTDRNTPVTEKPHPHPTRQRSGRRRRSSPSSASMRDPEKLEDIHPAFRKDAYLPQSSAEDITALPVSRALQNSPHLRPVTQDHGIPYNFQSSLSHSSLPAHARERGKLRRPQSLRRDPASESLVRRISSKRRRDHDHIREEEIRAMSLPMPQKRPAGSSGGMLRRDSKKVKGALNHRFERPMSNISLPLQDSIHSSMSGNSERRAFRVSALDMFSPRPTIRCSVGSQYYATDRTSPTALPARNDSRRERRPLSSRDEKQKNRTSRIDDLADTLDAGALREILERDKRRRDKKARNEQERLRRRLERRAEKQNAVAEIGGTPATPRREATGVVGLGIADESSTTPMEDVRPSTPPQPQRLEIMPTTPRTQEISQLPTPLESPIEEPVVSDARAIRYSRGSVSGPAHARGPSNVSQLPELISEKLAQDTPVESVEQSQDPFRSGSLHPVDTVETTASKRGSTRRRSSDGRRMGVFASLFRRGKRNSQDQGRTTPSEISFSNTSRESMSRQPLPAHLVGAAPATPPIQIRRPSSVPRRTMSKFREDLPEFPISPPDSRVQSPEAHSTSALAARRRSQIPSDLRVESLHSSVGQRPDSPVSPGIPVANIMSQSLASVDSEASWLSGKPPKRASNRSQFRSSVASSAVQKNEAFNASYEELGMADDEYFRRLTPQPGQSSDLLGRKASSTLMALDAAAESDEEVEVEPSKREPNSEEEELVQTVPGRQPTIIHRQPRVKSTEGLLSFFTNDKTATEEQSPKSTQADPQTPDSPSSETEPVMVQRAKSVELGKNHVRHLSAGSAKLLDIQKRSSTPSHSRMAEQD
ncbi:hypothetical protein FB567DRAFT_325607 [Paraphoma chrysanthemicola]|uniref:Uncharacterized protein n=1 Tax=Paraphoma chrysanthemicola TaxID=798071 RepID=A0A8K0RBN1_9PLEO|nr:hypothetical protein FB567DRAFT_325607 [Paraphoma chrysanthemicola]